jgi:hypothetical protein
MRILTSISIIALVLSAAFWLVASAIEKLRRRK